MKRKIFALLFAFVALMCLTFTLSVSASTECCGITFDREFNTANIENLEAGNYYLTGDYGNEETVISLAASEGEKQINIALCGHTLTAKYIVIGANVSLSIYDNTETGKVCFLYDDPRNVTDEITEGFVMRSANSSLKIVNTTVEHAGRAVLARVPSKENAPSIYFENATIKAAAGCESNAIYMYHANTTLDKGTAITNTNNVAAIKLEYGDLYLKNCSIENTASGACVACEKNDGVIHLYGGASFSSADGKADIELDNYTEPDFSIKIEEALTAGKKIKICNGDNAPSSVMVTDFLTKNPGANPNDFFTLISSDATQYLTLDGNDVKVGQLTVSADENGNAAANEAGATYEWYAVNRDYRKATNADFSVMKTYDEGSDEVDAVYDAGTGLYHLNNVAVGTCTVPFTTLHFVQKKGIYPATEEVCVFYGIEEFSVIVRVNGEVMTADSSAYNSDEAIGNYDAEQGCWKAVSEYMGHYCVYLPITSKSAAVECELTEDLTVATSPYSEGGEFSALLFTSADMEVYIENLEVFDKVCEGKTLNAPKTGSYVCYASYADAKAASDIISCTVSAAKPWWIIIVAAVAIIGAYVAGYFCFYAKGKLTSAFFVKIYTWFGKLVDKIRAKILKK